MATSASSFRKTQHFNWVLALSTMVFAFCGNGLSVRVLKREQQDDWLTRYMYHRAIMGG